MKSAAMPKGTWGSMTSALAPDGITLHFRAWVFMRSMHERGYGFKWSHFIHRPVFP